MCGGGGTPSQIVTSRTGDSRCINFVNSLYPKRDSIYFDLSYFELMTQIGQDAACAIPPSEFQASVIS